MSKTLSIIIPVYGTEKYLRRCIESVINQSYTELEIIIVNDSSNGNCKEIVEEYKTIDKRIQYIEHVKNKGLFQARVSGAKIAKGDYIAFLDSDDYVSLDYYRSMVLKAENGNYDIVANDTVRETEIGVRSQFVLHKICFPVELKGEDVKNQFFGQAGACYAWHTIWNKIYRKTLWDKCMPAYCTLNKHIIMTEDIAFSSILFFNATSFASIKNGVYYYCINEGASTNSVGISYEKYSKNVGDIADVFDFVNNYLVQNKASKYVLENFNTFRARYALIWENLRKEYFSGFKYNSKSKDLIEKIAKIDESIDKKYGEYYFENSISSFCDNLESIRCHIASDGIKVVSFDIFDTLLLRPLWNAEDIFKLMQKKFEDICPDFKAVCFCTIRKLSEQRCREKISYLGHNYQDVTLTEIYDVLKDYLNISSEQALELKLLEINTEIDFIQERKTGKQLLEFALSLGKEVVLTSDMYLEKATIEEMLKKCGYPLVPLFLSSEVRLLKSTGSLFEYVSRKLKVAPQNILHIGDNWNVDIVTAKNKGFNTDFLPKTKDIFCNQYKDNNTNNLSVLGNIAGNYINVWNTSFSSISYRSMMALVANRLFDNPFISWNHNSDLDGNPFVMGYYTMGMHLLAVSCWLADIVKKEKVKHISFLSRDGFMPLKAFDILRQYFGLENVTINYVPCSRSALMPHIINDKSGLYNLPINYQSYNPLTLVKLLKCCCEETDETIICRIIKKAGFIPELNFGSQMVYYNFIKFFSENMFSIKKLEAEKNIVSEYYSNQIPKNSLVFDLGYSGRIPAALSRSIKYDVIYAYIHKDYSSIDDYIRQNKIDIRVMYDFVPQNRDLIRELFFSEYDNQCAGIVQNDNVIKPIFNNNMSSYVETFVISSIHNAALEFIKDFVSNFKCYIKYNEIPQLLCSMPFEGMLSFCKNNDRKIFMSISTEDGVFSNRGSINVAEFWSSLNDESACIKAYNKNVGNQNITQSLNVDDEIYMNGLFMKFYYKINEIAPKGGRKRFWLKKIARLFLK